jgi:hypothetical protein
MYLWLSAKGPWGADLLFNTNGVRDRRRGIGHKKHKKYKKGEMKQQFQD